MSVLLLAALLTQNGMASCAADSLVVSSVAVANVAQNGAVNHYQLRVTVANHGASQGGNVLQSIDIFRNGTKADQKGVPPLKAGASYSFLYPYDRNSDAGDGTTSFVFRTEAQQPGGGEVCYGSREGYRFSV